MKELNMKTYKTLVKETMSNLKEIQKRIQFTESALNDLAYFDPTKELILENYSEEQLDDIASAMDIDKRNDMFYVDIDYMLAKLEREYDSSM